ncbi:MAG TPA: ribosome biogenesis factor YjgA [Burkholderiales bacterium]
MDGEFVSKTQKKKEMTDLQKMGVELAALPLTQLESLGIPDNLKTAIVAFNKIRSHEAKRRQMQYVGRLMRDVDAAPIRALLESVNSGSAQSAAAHKRLEAWREKLLADDGALTEFASAFPGSDLQKIRTLIRNAKRERDTGKPPHSYRELFRLIKQCSDSNPS